jgi:hypothetical protein
LLSNLARRAAAARAKRPLLDDPFAVEAVERLDYGCFTDVSPRGASWHALRVATSDGAVVRFLKRNPDGHPHQASSSSLRIHKDQRTRLSGICTQKPVPREQR